MKYPKKRIDLTIELTLLIVREIENERDGFLTQSEVRGVQNAVKEINKIISNNYRRRVK